MVPTAVKGFAPHLSVLDNEEFPLFLCGWRLCGDIVSCLAASGAVLAVSFTVTHENAGRRDDESRAHEVLTHLLFGFMQCVTAWPGQIVGVES